MFFAFFFFVAGLTYYVSTSKGTQVGMWFGWLAALTLAPVWIARNFGSVQMDLRSAAALVILMQFAMQPPAKFRFKLMLGDILAVLLLVGQVTSQYLCGDLRPLTGPELARNWFLPYLIGRLFISAPEDIQKILPLAAKIIVVMSIYAVVEALTKRNPVNLLLGKTYGLLEQGEGYRWGIKRAQGNLDHPIFYGMLLVMIFPWAVEAWRQARHGLGPKWWRWLPLMLAAAVFCTASRGPQICFLFTFGVTAFFRRPKWRLPMLAAALIGGAALFAGKDLVMEHLESMAGETEEMTRIILINGEEHEYSGTKHRTLLWLVYDEYLRNASWFGYGFRLQGVELEETIAQRFGSIDNGYILFFLRYGWFGLSVFLAMGLCAIVYLARIAWNPQVVQAGLAGSMCGALFAVAVLLLSVWFAPDFGACWLFCVGLATSLAGLPRKLPPSNGAPLSAAPVVVRRAAPRRLHRGSPTPAA